jgi:hypothetical protein
MSTSSKLRPTPEKRSLPLESPMRHSHREAFIFYLKVRGLQTRRMLDNAKSGAQRLATQTMCVEYANVLAESITPLWTEASPEERYLVAGKVQNLRVAIRAIHGIIVPAGEVFSFWNQVGRTTKNKGYVAGRELREGCLIPNIGGGLCQLSNALYDAALKAGFEITERHAHTRTIPGSLAEQGRDATVFWNYLDLRFRATTPFQIEAKLDAEQLTVRFLTPENTPMTVAVKPPKRITLPKLPMIIDQSPNSCVTCGDVGCFRHVEPETRPTSVDRVAYLVDEVTPEFRNWLVGAKQNTDILFLPLDGEKTNKPNYAWRVEGFSRVQQSVLLTLSRAYQSRKLKDQGATRQCTLLQLHAKLAHSYAKRLTYDTTHLVIQQNLLPFLWLGGHLGGRTFDVLMNTLPLGVLQTRLDEAATHHPESTTLGDFRADPALILAEKAALAAARSIITPHTEIVSLFPERAQLLAWETPISVTGHERAIRPLLVFPAATVGRKGAYELREALRGWETQIDIATTGPQLEGEDFWEGFSVIRRTRTEDYLNGAWAVVLPAYVENRPRALLLAQSRGIPVIATPACGLPDSERQITVPMGEVNSLRVAIASALF